MLTLFNIISRFAAIVYLPFVTAPAGIVEIPIEVIYNGANSFTFEIDLENGDFIGYKTTLPESITAGCTKNGNHALCFGFFIQEHGHRTRDIFTIYILAREDINLTFYRNWFFDLNGGLIDSVGIEGFVKVDGNRCYIPQVTK